MTNALLLCVDSYEIQEKSLLKTIRKVDCIEGLYVFNVSTSTTCFAVSSSNKSVLSTDT